MRQTYSRNERIQKGPDQASGLVADRWSHPVRQNSSPARRAVKFVEEQLGRSIVREDKQDSSNTTEPTAVEDQQRSCSDQASDFTLSDDSPQREPVCATCGGKIRRDDIVCSHCGETLVSG